MGLEPVIQVRGPAAVCPIDAADDVDETGHDLFYPMLALTSHFPARTGPFSEAVAMTSP